MQVLQYGKPVEEQATKDFLLEIQADRYCRAILESASDLPKSAKQLSQGCNVPISTAYRRIQQMHDHKLLSISGTINEDGKKFFLYKSKIRAIVSFFDGSSVQVEIVPNTGFPAN
ncbi:MAG TPA: ArsR family transcriptional regulator [Candidatus Nitrosotalea sp.]|nr:ArsR family transcriptional regulator [Candidatus Nitrosotalea sp.]